MEMSLGMFSSQGETEMNNKNFTLRSFKEEDIPEIVSVVKRFTTATHCFGEVNHFADIDFSDEKVYNYLTRNIDNPAFMTTLVIDESGKIVGGISGGIYEYLFSKDKVAKEQIMYILPEFANVQLLFALLENFISWAKTFNIREIQIGTSTGYKQGKFDILMKRFGFTQFEAGYSLKG